MKNLFLTVSLFIAATISAQVSYSFNSQSSDFQITTNNNYKIVTSSESKEFTTEVGSPQLPVFTKSFVLPAGSTLTNIIMSNQDEVLLDGNITVYPTQPPLEWDSVPAFVPPAPVIYNSSNVYPANTVIKTGDSSAQGYRIITLDICPFKYIPSQKKLYLYQTVNISIQYTIGNIEKTEKITQRRQKLTEEWVASQVENPELLKYMPPTAKTILDQTIETDKFMLRWKPSAYDSYVPEYVIITNEALKPIFEQLADYKTKRGFTTLLVTTEQIYPAFPGVDNAEKIRNYLKAVYKYWGAGMFILLGGDTAIIPGRLADYRTVGGKLEISPSDLYYSDVYKQNDLNYNWNLNGNDKFGENYGDGVESGVSDENYIGRAPVDTELEAQNFIDKIVKYEKLDGVPSNSRNYVNNMLFLGAYYHHINSGNPTTVGGQKWHDELYNEPYLDTINNPTLKKW